jgi:hypothetical protein
VETLPGLITSGNLTKNWPSVIFLAFLATLGGILLLFVWARYLVRESREPFRYTFSVEPFTPISGSEILNSQWLRHDLARRLAERIPRLSILGSKETDSDSDNGPEAPLPHIKITGEYGARRSANRKSTVEVTPQVQIGRTVGPARLGRRVLRDDSAVKGELDARTYEEIVEAVYFNVASEVYKQIREDVEAKIELLPTRRLRATAFLHEAEDYCRSNTLDAYSGGCGLFDRARHAYDPVWQHLPMSTWPKRLTRLRRAAQRAARRARRWAASLFPALGRRELLTARAEIGVGCSCRAC